MRTHKTFSKKNILKKEQGLHIVKRDPHKKKKNPNR